MNNVDKQYFDLLRTILKTGTEKKDRTGTGTLSMFDYTMRFNMQEGFPLLTSKKMAWKAMVVELLWFLKGDTNIKWLVENGCMIWVGDAYKAFQKHRTSILSVKPPASETGLAEYIDWYEQVDSREKFIEKIKTDNEFSKKHGELGPVYGAQWRKWRKGERMVRGCDLTTEEKKGREEIVSQSNASVRWPVDIYIDQISDLIKNLKENPDSRRLMVNAWNVADLDNMTLPPCHYGFQCYTRELSLKERYTLTRQYGLAPKYDFDLVDGKPVPPSITEEEHYNKYNVPKRALSLKWTQRSVDVFLGLPFNIASYGLLLTMLAKEVNMIPEDLIFSGGDIHIYSNHIEQCKQQLKQQTFKLPSLSLNNKSIFDLEYSDIKLNNYESAPSIKGELSN